jgi:phosphatidylserine/phosphatidylglycerophosphate/cardiolipin synthase-like enzyme
MQKSRLLCCFSYNNDNDVKSNMIDVLTNTSSITGKIIEIIQNAEKELVIVSPYVQLKEWPKIADELKIKIQEKGNMPIIFIIRAKEKGKPNKALEEVKQYAKTCKIYLVPHLHSKTYYNGKQALITSMNLYKYSADENQEIGVYFEDEDIKIKKIKRHISGMRSAESSEEYVSEEVIAAVETKVNEIEKDELTSETFTVLSKGYKWVKVMTTEGYENRVELKLVPGLKEDETYTANVKRRWYRTKYGRHVEYTEVQDLFKVGGHCIICNADIDLNPDSPLCKPCYFKNKKFRGNIFGKVCHQCGKSNKGILDSRPLCKNCY